MSILPANKLLKIIVGTTFDYPFQYLVGTPSSSAPFNLTGYTAEWTIVPNGGFIPVTYTTVPTTHGSAVVFGGDGDDPTTGIIDLVISATDSAAIPWLTGVYTLALYSPASPSVVTQLLGGGVGIVGALPT
jgi:hypothetical protein